MEGEVVEFESFDEGALVDLRLLRLGEPLFLCCSGAGVSGLVFERKFIGRGDGGVHLPLVVSAGLSSVLRL